MQIEDINTAHSDDNQEEFKFKQINIINFNNNYYFIQVDKVVTNLEKLLFTNTHFIKIELYTKLKT